MIETTAPRMRRWVREVCDRQDPYDGNRDDLDTWLYWEDWRAPAFTIRRNRFQASSDTVRDWKRESEQATDYLLTSFEKFCVRRNEAALSVAVGEAALAMAKEAFSPESAAGFPPASIAYPPTPTISETHPQRVKNNGEADESIAAIKTAHQKATPAQNSSREILRRRGKKKNTATQIRYAALREIVKGGAKGIEKARKLDGWRPKIPVLPSWKVNGRTAVTWEEAYANGYSDNFEDQVTKANNCK